MQVFNLTRLVAISLVIAIPSAKAGSVPPDRSVAFAPMWEKASSKAQRGDMYKPGARSPDTLIADLHSSFKEEIREPGWADKTEETVRRRFSSSKLLADFPKNGTVQCKKHICEVLLVYSGKDSPSLLRDKSIEFQKIVLEFNKKIGKTMVAVTDGPVAGQGASMLAYIERV